MFSRDLIPSSDRRKSMELCELKRNWEGFGEVDPLYAILTAPEMVGNRWDPERFFETGRSQIEKILKRCRKLAVSPPRGKALDFGCGVGRLSQSLAAHFDEVHGVDIAASMIANAERYNRHPEKCFYHVNEETNLEAFPSNEFAFICSLITLQHMRPEYSRQYLAEFARILRPGGVMVFQLPDRPTRWRRTASFASALVKGLSMRLDRGAPQENAVNPHHHEALANLHMEMYGVPRREVADRLAAGDVRVVAADRDKLAGKPWLSWVYYCQKVGGAG